MLTYMLVGLLTAAASDAPVYVEIESDVPGTMLIRHEGTSYGSVYTSRGTATLQVDSFRKECVAPCEQHVEKPSGTFLLTGNGMTPSNAFTLLGHGESVKLKVKGGSGWMRWGGATLLVTGLSAALVGGIMLLTTSAFDSPSGVANPYPSATRGANSAGWGLFLGGAGAVAVSVPLIAFSGTKVDFLPGPSVPAKMSKPGETVAMVGTAQ